MLQLTNMRKLATLILLFAVVCIAVKVNAEPWRGIVPLKSTRLDVERLLGKPQPGEMRFSFESNDDV